MQQRQLRLGDILDDYCPRERRLTNHAIVALVGDEIRQTRCTTCDSEHEYKQARVPPQRKKKDASGALYQQVLSSAQPRKVSPAAVLDPPLDDIDETPGEAAVAPPVVDADTTDVDTEAEAVAGPTGREDPDDGPVHRRLIRATLPRLEGQEPPARREPDFTFRGQPPGRGRHGHGGGRGGHRQAGQQHVNGNRVGGKRHGHGSHSGAPHRQGGNRPPNGGHGNRHHRSGGGKKRSR